VTSITEAQCDLLRERIENLTAASISVSAVDVKETDGADGPGVLVTVRLTAPRAGTEWDADDFLSIRRQARTAAVEELNGQDVRLVYVSDDLSDVADDEVGDIGDKQSLDQDS
jgi:hypothetical protein